MRRQPFAQDVFGQWRRRSLSNHAAAISQVLGLPTTANSRQWPCGKAAEAVIYVACSRRGIPKSNRQRRGLAGQGLVEGWQGGILSDSVQAKAKKSDARHPGSRLRAVRAYAIALYRNRNVKQIGMRM